MTQIAARDTLRSKAARSVTEATMTLRRTAASCLASGWRSREAEGRTR
jgi:hypothetical protein